MCCTPRKMMQPDKNKISTKEIKPVMRNGAMLRSVVRGNTINTVGTNSTTLET
jgi:hypothetical protein